MTWWQVALLIGAGFLCGFIVGWVWLSNIIGAFINGILGLRKK